jgi:hypothetical protein
MDLLWKTIIETDMNWIESNTTMLGFGLDKLREILIGPCYIYKINVYTFFIIFFLLFLPLCIIKSKYFLWCNTEQAREAPSLPSCVFSFNFNKKRSFHIYFVYLVLCRYKYAYYIFVIKFVTTKWLKRTRKETFFFLLSLRMFYYQFIVYKLLDRRLLLNK